MIGHHIVINGKYAIRGHQYGMGTMILIMIAALFGILFQLEFRGN